MQRRALIEGRDAALRGDAGQSSRAHRREPLRDGAQLGDQEALTGVSADLQEALCAEGLTDRRGISMAVSKGGETIRGGIGFLRTREETSLPSQREARGSGHPGGSAECARAAPGAE